MRNFDERRAEVYRRSEERIKERKRKIKTNIAVIVTPIVLCTFFAGAYFNVVMRPSHDSAPPGAIRGDDGSFDQEIGETLRQPEGEKTDGNDSDAAGETGAPAVAPDTDGDGKDEVPSSSGIRYVQFEVYAPNGTVSVHRDTNEITETVNLIDEFTNGEATIYGFDGNVVQIPHTTIPKYDFKVVLTTNFGLEWRYAVTKNSIIFLANGKSYPINEEQFELLKETLGIKKY